MRAREFDQELDEGWRDTVAGLALGAGVAMGSPAQASGTETVVVQPGQTVYSIARAFGTTPQVIQRLNRLGPDFRIEPNQEILVPAVPVTSAPAQAKPQKAKATPSGQAKPAEKIKTKTGSPRESLLRRAAAAGGITNPVELAAFLAQSTIETGGFGSLDEKGGRRRIERLYDPKYNPKGAERIGNTKVGDGWRYRGRGFLQLTGRYNYTEASRALGLNLVKNPDLVLKPEVAAQTAVWYWKWRVRPNVDNNYYDTERITALVQGADSHLERRQRAFQDFLQFQLAQI